MAVHPALPNSFIPSAIAALTSFDVGPDILLPSLVISPSISPHLPPSARNPTTYVDALRYPSNPTNHAAPMPNPSYVLGPYPSSILSLFRLGPKPSESGAANVPTVLDVDPQIVEVFKSKDRLYILKLGEQTECLINDHRHVSLPSPNHCV
ncbi:hypothetical protein F5141DRAFT_1212499 [Pisolithus sp. B1]|nr:hypothetical protein F5141DRAFT_1212499 [Pisolithus sp. B1]